ncbi:MAG: hypothetical protein A2172_04355 [Candidatus Woykebacteria bacterium RBG_13_40_15]|uniref:Uncharacterized protein n=1 Tax=Candidatus Woykebacteria bacterium RBG_13_40_15 TaxID=1802593 RepID=A0A1G1W6X9_9BACT|nr:MAG: hypothetical protein A2172_04355 [Candidatus Woykebacteria bacterium RBG_13_40_15]
MNPSFIPVPPRLSSILSRRRSRRLKLKLFSSFVTAGFILFIVTLVGASIAFGFFARNLPSPNKLSDHNFSQSTKIYDRNGTLLYNIYGDENRTLVKLDKVPADLRNATVAIEDKRFYKHRGFDIVEYIRAIKEIVVDHRLTGASTITQQLVKNSLLTSERTLTRKVKELILSIQIERRYSKDEILQMYLNEVPYGGTSWGTEAAANQYFGKHTWELNLVECAILAGLPQSPTAYSPFGLNSRAYINRTKDVLRRMREDGYITSDQEKKAVKALPNVKFASFGQDIKAPHFSIYVKTLLEEKYGPRLVQEGGFQVTTTLDLKLQDMAQKAVTDQVAAEKYLTVSNGAAVIENVKTGEILAWVGSKDYFAKDIPGKFDIVSQAIRQPGSALKPFNYLTGFEKGYANPATMFIDTRTDFGGGYRPGNYDDREHGPLPVRIALGNSYNIPAVKMLAVNGVENVIDTLKRFGITTLNDPSQYGLSLTLGGGAIKLLELTNAYAILGNQGKVVSPQVILKVTDSNGRVIEEFKPSKDQKEATDPEHAYLINNILSDPTAKYMGYGTYWAHLLNFRPDVAVKTGTSEQKIDNWTFGYSPSYVVGTWVGNNDNSPMNPALSSGITGAAPIFRIISTNLWAGKPVDSWNRPAGVVDAKVDALTGMKPGKHSGSLKTEIFAKWQIPTQEDDMHKEARICIPSGLVANSSCEAAGKATTKLFLAMYDPYTKMFMPSFRYCPAGCPPTTTDTGIYTPKADKLSVVISSPQDNAEVTSDFTVSANIAGPTSIDKAWFYLDGDLTEKINSPSSSIKYKFTGVADGDHIVVVWVHDSAGDTAEETINIKVQNTPGP